MTVQNTPFFILGLPCSAGRREIAAAAEELILLLDSDSCTNAQNELINLNKRLIAELGWFIDFGKERIQIIRETIKQKAEIPTDGLTALSRFNASLYNFSISAEDPYELGYSILDLDEQYSKLDLTEITAVINRNRSTANIAEVSESEVANELNRKREDIRHTISNKVEKLDQGTYAELITILAEKCIADEEYEDGAILSDVVDQYEVRIQSQLEKSAEDISNYIDQIRKLENDDAIKDSIDVLIRQVEEWDKLAQPLQLKSKASGIPHEISEDLGMQLHGLVRYLHNEKRTQDALHLIDAMRGIFAELGGLSDLFASDSDMLNTYIQGKDDFEAVSAEMDVLLQQSKTLKAYATPSSTEAFIARTKKLDIKIRSMKMDEETRTKIRENLCYIARNVAIELHNSKHDTSTALSMIKALVIEFGDIPFLQNKLREDGALLKQQLLLANDSHAASTGHFLLLTPFQRTKGAFLDIILAVIVAVVFIISSIEESTYLSPSSYTNTPSTSPSTHQSNTAAENKLKSKIDTMESKLLLMKATIDDYEKVLFDLNNDIEMYKSQYYSTGFEYYYNAYYNAVNDYNSTLTKNSNKVDEYNELYYKYSAAIDEYNSKIEY